MAFEACGNASDYPQTSLTYDNGALENFKLSWKLTYLHNFSKSWFANLETGAGFLGAYQKADAFRA